MSRLRWLAWLSALFGGWFWLPCPLCGRSFAGFEASERTVVPDRIDPHRAYLVCRRCGG